MSQAKFMGRWSKLIVATGFASACSFYTDCPCANQPANQGNGGSAGGPASGGYAGFVTEGGAAGAAGEPTNVVAEWENVTGSMANRNSACGNITMLSVKPDDGSVIAGLSEAGLFVTNDRGATWTALGDGPQSTPITNRPSQIVYDPDEPSRYWLAGTYVTPGIYRTDDDGVTFESLGDAWHNEYLSIDFSDAKRKTLLAGSHEQAQTLWRSSDGGDTWDQIGANVPTDCSWTTYPVIVDSETYLLGCGNGIWRSTDAGDTWGAVSALGGAAAPLIASDGAVYWVDGDGGLEASTDAGATWTRVVGGGVLSKAAPVELPDGRLAALAGQGILLSADGGVHWSSITPQLTFMPTGLVYSAVERAFYVWNSTCNPTVPVDAIQRFAFDYEAP